MEGENEEQSSTDQAFAIKTKNVFIAQNVASLQELGKTRNCHQKAVFSAFTGALLEKNQAGRGLFVKSSLFITSGGSEKLLRVCLNLPYFLRYINRFQDAVLANSFFIMPATVADATAVRNG